MNTYLITGGAGSLGRKLVEQILITQPDSTIRILDNNEYSLSQLKNTNIRKLYGDICDKSRVEKAISSADIVIHCAAMKNIEITEYNAPELIKVNILGTDNIISSAIDANVKKLMFISTDKSVEPSTIYGASKLLCEHLALNYNKTNKHTRISVFRSGNFSKSNGNVFDVWENQLKVGNRITITDLNCRRHFIDIDIAAYTILRAINNMSGGEIYIPSEKIMPICSMDKLIKSAGIKLTNENHIITGLRHCEKLSEQLMTTNEELTKVYDEATKCWIIR
jgi:UDP-N-acetylglucosamine 4,6-dehydratase